MKNKCARQQKATIITNRTCYDNRAKAEGRNRIKDKGHANEKNLIKIY